MDKQQAIKQAFELPTIERVGTVGEMTLQNSAMQITDVPIGSPVGTSAYDS
ncbi:MULTISPECIES: hypothetical protein [Halomonadaceae]|uniref:hypothetical protein n=1 Tax=Halomonadaceae TaxID=28256 RepID=UPI001598BFEF|nr:MULTISPECIES: hypothetical protein [Halomonas]QJQ94018.1 hypothetical protein HIO72_01035 [Halomonas sp. PA5]